MKEKARDILLEKAFGRAPSNAIQAPAGDGKDSQANTSAEKPASQASFNDLIEKWAPETQADWALLGAYYFQKVLDHGSVTGFQVNGELKNHGNGMENITQAFKTNIDLEPARMRQVRKSGKSKQSRKQYVVTTAGIKFVESKLNGVEEG